MNPIWLLGWIEVVELFPSTEILFVLKQFFHLPFPLDFTEVTVWAKKKKVSKQESVIKLLLAISLQKF